HDARRGVGRAAGREGHDQRDGLGRKLGERCVRDQREQQNETLQAILRIYFLGTGFFTRRSCMPSYTARSICSESSWRNLATSSGVRRTVSSSAPIGFFGFPLAPLSICAP